MNENLKKWQSSVRPNDKKLIKIKDLFDWPFGFVRPVKQALKNLAVWFKTDYGKVELFGLKQAKRKISLAVWFKTD